MTGVGRLTFQWWGRVFRDYPVCLLKGLDRPILFGLCIQREVGLQLDLWAMRGAFKVSVYMY